MHKSTELDLGQHTLILNSDGSMELLVHETPEQTAYGLILDHEETYRLFISLQEQFKRKEESQ